MVCTPDSDRVDVKFINYKNTTRLTMSEKKNILYMGRRRDREESANMKQQVLDGVPHCEVRTGTMAWMLPIDFILLFWAFAKTRRRHAERSADT